MDVSKMTKTSHILQAENEFTFEVDINTEAVYLQLEIGSAEIAGTSLALMKQYRIPANTKATVFTWYGCKINLFGNVNNQSTSRNASMVMYMNLHGGLNDLRQSAEQNKARGPRVMVVGSTSLVKSTLCKILANYAARSGWCPTLADLDVNENAISFSGTMAALPMCQPVDIENGFTYETPITYHFGRPSPKCNLKLYDTLVARLAESVNSIHQISGECQSSGIIIGASDWYENEGYKSLLKSIKVFDVNLILVLEDDRLFQKLTREVSCAVKVLPLPSPGGVSGSPQKSWEEKTQMIKSYFYGNVGNIFPHLIQVKFSDVQIYQTSSMEKSQNGVVQEGSIRLDPMPVKNALQYRVFSTSHAMYKHEDVVGTTISGYVVIMKVDMEKQLVTLLSSQPRPFQSKIFLLHEGLTFEDL